VIARWEGDFDDKRAQAFGTPQEIGFDTAAGEPAFAQAAVEGE
jgi:hypothetical protein